MQANQSNDQPDLSFFQCYICFQTVRKPKMCPSCSKLACQTCLRTWIEDRRPQCPHCRKALPLSNFADCERFVNDVKHLIKTIDQNQKIKTKCQQHNMEMQYYCSDCNQAICSDCGMFGSKHRGHAITHLKKVYQQNKNKILNELAKFDNKIQGYRKNGYFIKVEMQKLIMAMGQKKTFIEEFFVTSIERLEEQFKEKQQKISQKFQLNSRQIQFLQTFRDNICQQLEGQTQKELITKSEEFIRCINSLCDRNAQYQPQQYTFDTIHEIVPKYKKFNFILKNYHSLPQAIVYSQPFIVNGIQWRLKVYPKGNGIAKDTHISVFLQMSKAYVNENKYEYKIELYNHLNSKQSVIREYSSKFDIGECWGYNQFIPIAQLDNGFLTNSGNLHFDISVRNENYRSLVRDQQRYVEYLEKAIFMQNSSAIVENKIKKQNKMNELVQQAGKKKDNPRIYLQQQSDIINRFQEIDEKNSLSLIEFLHNDLNQEGEGHQVIQNRD